MRKLKDMNSLNMINVTILHSIYNTLHKYYYIHQNLCRFITISFIIWAFAMCYGIWVIVNWRTFWGTGARLRKLKNRIRTKIVSTLEIDSRRYYKYVKLLFYASYIRNLWKISLKFNFIFSEFIHTSNNDHSICLLCL